MNWNFKLFLSILWLLFTFSLSAWWFVFVLQSISSSLPAERVHNMIFWEGTTLLLSILVGGGILIFYIHKDQGRHQQLKLFFSSFSHDIKTSISRLRLQSELISEDKQLQGHIVIRRLLTDINHLDIQLENSLLISNLDETQFLQEKINLVELLRSLETEFESIRLNVSGNGIVLADSRALRSVLRNLFENSIRHGSASLIDAKISSKANQLELSLKDNGKGSRFPTELLGKQPIQQSSSEGSGIGLYLVKQLVRRMQGQIHFENNSNEGFQSTLLLRGGRE